MILNYNCYQVQQGDQAPSLGSPFCQPPPPAPNSELWDQLIGIGGMTWPPLAGGGGVGKHPSLPPPSSTAQPTPPPEHSYGWVAKRREGAEMDWRPLRPAQLGQLGELTPQLLESSLELAIGNVCLHVNTCVSWIQFLAGGRP